MKLIYVVLILVVFSSYEVSAQYNQVNLVFTDVSHPLGITDLNGDGLPDILYKQGVNFNALINNGDLSFEDPVVVATSPFVLYSLGFTDLNGDGLMDMWGRQVWADVALVSIQLSLGVFSEFFPAPSGFWVRDIDTDGLGEIINVVTEINGEPVCPDDGNYHSAVIAYDYLGGQSFSEGTIIQSNCEFEEFNVHYPLLDSQEGLLRPLVTDLTFDGINDFVIGFGSNSFGYYAGVFALDGQTFGQPNVVPQLFLGNMSSVVADDVDYDGDIDWISNTGPLAVHVNTGSEYVTPDMEVDGYDGNDNTIWFCDMNGDDYKDLFVSGTNVYDNQEVQGTYVFLNDGNNYMIGSDDPDFMPFLATPEVNSGDVVVADFNNDGIEEFVGNFYDGQVSVPTLFYTQAPPVGVEVDVFADFNGNGILDEDDVGLEYQALIVDDNSVQYTNENGEVILLLPVGLHSVEYSSFDALIWSPTTPSTQSVEIANGIANPSALSFGLEPIGVVYGVEAYLTSSSENCGSEAYFTLEVVNIGNAIMQGNIQISLDALYSYTGSATPELSIDGNNVVWSFENLLPDNALQIQFFAIAPTDDFIGDEILHVLTMNAEDEFGNVIETFNQEFSNLLFCAANSNDKLTNTGYSEAGYILANTVLDYTIRFQNTGNYTATNVRVEDQLIDLLQWNTLQPVAWSHDFNLSIDETGHTVFNFENIMLPDSMSDEPGSHGFVRFTIMQDEDLPAGTEIENAAEIFFDLNQPIVTNTTLNTIMECEGIADFTFDFDNGCPGTYVLGNANADLGETYTWTIDGVEVSTGTNLYTALMESGTFDVVLTVSNPLCDVSSTQPFLVHEVITPEITQNDQELMASGTGDFQWMFNGMPIDGATSSTYVPTEDGMYSVSLVDEHGCYSTSEPLNFVSVEEVNDFTITISPNPVTNSFIVQCGSSLKGEMLIITDMQGRIVHRESITSSPAILDAGDWASGVYALRIGDRTPVVVTKE